MTLRTFLGALALCAIAAGCGGSSAGFLPLESHTVPLEKISSRHHRSAVVYKLPKTGDATVFTSALHQCDIKPTLSDEADLRQLLVGLERLEIASRERLILADAPTMKASLLAAESGEPLFMTVYLQRSNECVTDIAFWSGSDAALSESQHLFDGIASQLLSSTNEEVHE